MKPEQTEKTTKLPTLVTSLNSEQVFTRLLKLSKQGKLAGYVHQVGDSYATVDAHGNPFDSDLRIQHTGHAVEFELAMRKKLPLIFAVLLVITVWPGLPLTESFMLTMGWYERLVSGSFETWMWYLPMTVLPIPFVWRSSMMKSVQSAHEHALETVDKVRSVITE